MSAYEQLKNTLRASPKRWLVTGAAGFIGSNLLETLLSLNQRVIGLDNFSTGHQRNFDEVRLRVGPERAKNLTELNADIRDADACHRACAEVDYVLHQAALGSVPRSLENPIATHQSNVDGFLNMLWAAKQAKVKRFVYASSSSVYGDHPALPKIEPQIGNCLSPYAASKRMNELYADVFSRNYGIPCIGLRYFNVFGPRQDPEGQYAAVIPRWIAAMLHNEPVHINGDGQTSRDFCYIANVVQANLLAATTAEATASHNVYNIAVGQRTDLNQLFEMLRSRLAINYLHLKDFKPVYRDFRPGDVRHSHADISKATQLLKYHPTHTIESGLDEALSWYVANAART